MNEEQIQEILDRVDARVDARVASMIGNEESVTPIAFEQKWMNGYHSTMPIDQALFRRFLHSLGDMANKTFKTIGNVVATQADDELEIVGRGGVTVSSQGKTIRVDGSTLSGGIKALMSWNDRDVNEAIVSSWMESDMVPSGMKNKYLEDLQDDSDWINYWQYMRGAIHRSQNQNGMWVAWDTEHMCYVEPGKPIPLMYARIYGWVWIPHLRKYMLVEEDYNASTGGIGHLAFEGKEYTMSDVLNKLFVEE